MKNILNKIKIDPCTYLLLTCALLSGYIKTIIIITIIVLFHELGHVTCFLLFKIPIEEIKLYPFGGLTIVNNRIHERIYKDIIISISGIVFQIILYSLIILLHKNNIVAETTWNIFKKYNTFIALFNLLPIIPLDGSKLINAILKSLISFNKSYIITTIISIISLLVLIIYNYIFKLNDIIIYIFFLVHIIITIKDYKLIKNKFYLERILYDHYYNKIINHCSNINCFRINKYYYFYKNKKYINEKEFLKQNLHK